MPERILRGHLVGAGLTAAIARCGDGMMLTGPEVPGGPLVCRLDRQGPCGSRLDEPLAQAACGLMAVHGRGPDPAELASDLWAATLLQRDRCAIVSPLWTFTE